MFDYRRSDFDGLRSHLQSLDLTALISKDGNINQDWLDCKHAFLAAVLDFVPTEKAAIGQNHLLWMNSTKIFRTINSLFDAPCYRKTLRTLKCALTTSI